MSRRPAPLAELESASGALRDPARPRGARADVLAALARPAGPGRRVAARRHDDGRAVPGIPHQARGRGVRPRRAGARRSRRIRVHVYTVDGRFVTPAEARARPLEVGASNWAATATLVARLVAGRDPGRHRHDVDRHHSDRRRPGGGAGPHRPRAAAERRAGLHRRGADAGGGAGARGAALGRAAPPSRPRDSPPSATRTSGSGGSPRRTTPRRPPTAGRRPASSPASGWRGWSAATARCSTTRRSTRIARAVVEAQLDQVTPRHPAGARRRSRRHDRAS